MARKRDMPCAECGDMMWRGGKSTLPEGVARCLKCRGVSGVFDPAKCGTRLGRDQHRRHGQHVCEPCRLAWNESCKATRERAKDRGLSPPGRPVPQVRRTLKACSGCGRAVLGTLPNPRCTECRGKQSGRHIKITTKARRAIYERDNWTCQLCQEPVDPTVSPLTRWGATLDHVEPWSAALIPDDRPSNLRLAHRRCNSVRGASVV